MLKQTYMNKIKQIKKQAENKKGDVQKLIHDLDKDIAIISLDGYSMTLSEATFDTSIQLKSGATIMTPTGNKPWTHLVNTKTIDEIIGSSKANHIKHAVPNCQYVISHVIPAKDNGFDKKNHFSHEYRQPTYKDVIDLINRFYAVKQQLETVDGQGVETDANSILEILEHAKRIGKHGFLKEAVHTVLHSNIAPDAQDTIDQNLNFKDKRNHEVVLKINKKATKMEDVATNKISKLTYPSFKLMVDNAILHLKKDMAGSTTIKSIKLNSEQKEIINKLKQIKNISNLHQQINQIHKLILNHLSNLDYKYGYIDYVNKYSEAKDDVKMGLEHYTKKQLEAFKGIWDIYSSFNYHSLSGEQLIASPKMAISLLNKYIKSIANKRFKATGKKWLDYVKKGNYVVVDDIEFDPISLKKQIRKVTKKDIDKVIGNIRFALISKQLLKNVLHQFKKKLLSGQFRVVKNKIKDMINNTNNRLDDLFASDINNVNSEYKRINMPIYHVNSITDSSDLISMINDIEDFEDY